MSQPTMQQVKELRERTQAGLNDCKGALTESGGDMEKAVEIILKKGLAKSAKRAGAVASPAGEGSATRHESRRSLRPHQLRPGGAGAADGPRRHRDGARCRRVGEHVRLVHRCRPVPWHDCARSAWRSRRRTKSRPGGSRLFECGTSCSPCTRRRTITTAPAARPSGARRRPATRRSWCGRSAGALLRAAVRGAERLGRRVAGSESRLVGGEGADERLVQAGGPEEARGLARG